MAKKSDSASSVMAKKSDSGSHLPQMRVVHAKLIGIFYAMTKKPELDFVDMSGKVTLELFTSLIK